MRLVWTTLTMILLAGGCSHYGQTPPEEGRLFEDIDPEEIEPACVTYTACTGLIGVGSCVSDLHRATYGPGRDWLITLGSMSDIWIGKLSLAQNVSCIAEAGADCDAALGCLNQGRVVRDCPRRGDGTEDAYCSTDSVLAVCMPPTEASFETSVRCDQAGMECVTIADPGTGTSYATCAHNMGSSDTIRVDCAGDIAEINAFGYQLAPYNCGRFGGTCRELETRDSSELGVGTFCQGTGESCSEDEFVALCDDGMVLGCSNGREYSRDCRGIGRECIQLSIDDRLVTACEFASCYPSVGVNAELKDSCESGVVTFCGPEGVTEVDCIRQGFSSCIQDLNGARCLP